MERQMGVYEDRCSLSTLYRKETGFSLQCKNLKQVKVAAIMDEFTEQCFAPECNLHQLTPQNWRNELIEFTPDILMVESAWRGKDKLWAKKANLPTEEILGVVDYCNRHKIPTVFWNKEDPVNYGHFISIAWAFDFVFTTDVDSIPRYKRDLGHNNVFFMHFAAQPAIHNPIELYSRKNKVCFAGSYYKKYPERQKDFQNAADAILEESGLDIYDRNYDRNDPSFEFPDQYKPYIIGTLPPNEIDKAYKGYRYNLNMNSVKNSSTMFARRVFELMASNTIVISNYAKGIKALFGDDAICSDETEELREEIQLLSRNEVEYEKYRLRGLRRVLKQHLYEDRLAYIIDTVFHVKMYYQDPPVSVVAIVEKTDQIDQILISYKKQNYKNKQLYIFTEDIELCQQYKEVHIYSLDEKNKVMSNKNMESYVSFFSPEDYYGKNYLTDLLLSYRYVNADAVGKTAYYIKCDKESPEVEHKEDKYSFVKNVYPYSSVFKYETGMKILSNIGQRSLSYPIELSSAFSSDSFNYCKNAKEEAGAFVDDSEKAEREVNILELCSQASLMKEMKKENVKKIFGVDFLQETRGDYIAVIMLGNNQLRLFAMEPQDRYEYLWGIEVGIVPENEYVFRMSGSFEFEATFGCVYYDQNLKKINNEKFRSNIDNTLNIPEKAAFLKPYVRVKGCGSGYIHNLFLIEKIQEGE